MGQWDAIRGTSKKGALWGQCRYDNGITLYVWSALATAIGKRPHPHPVDEPLRMTSRTIEEGSAWRGWEPYEQRFATKWRLTNLAEQIGTNVIPFSGKRVHTARLKYLKCMSKNSFLPPLDTPSSLCLVGSTPNPGWRTRVQTATSHPRSLGPRALPSLNGW